MTGLMTLLMIFMLSSLKVCEQILLLADIKEKLISAAKDAKSAKKNIYYPQMNANERK